MRRFKVLFVIAMLVSGFLIAPASAEASCSQTSVDFFENINFGGDAVRLCYPTNVPDFRNVAHPQAGSCNAIVKVGDDWNDCISTARNNGGTSPHCIRLYTGYNYTGSLFILFGSADWAWPDTFADSISSARWC